MSNKICVFVLGMHRSGTSATAGLLHSNGITAGKRLLGPKEDNKKGFFESKDVLEFHNTLFSQASTSWDSVMLELPRIFQRLKYGEVKSKLVKLLQAVFGEEDLFLVKDPRLCHTLPLWKDCLDELNIKHKVILVYRDYYSVYRSLQRRNNFSFQKCVLLWLKHNLQAERNSRGSVRVAVKYEDLINNLPKIVKSIEGDLFKSALHFHSFDIIDPALCHAPVKVEKHCSILPEDISLLLNELLQCLDTLNSSVDSVTLHYKFDKLFDKFQCLTEFFYFDELLSEARERVEYLKMLKNNQIL